MLGKLSKRIVDEPELMNEIPVHLWKQIIYKARLDSINANYLTFNNLEKKVFMELHSFSKKPRINQPIAMFEIVSIKKDKLWYLVIKNTETGDQRFCGVK